MEEAKYPGTRKVGNGGKRRGGLGSWREMKDQGDIQSMSVKNEGKDATIKALCKTRQSLKMDHCRKSSQQTMSLVRKAVTK